MTSTHTDKTWINLEGLKVAEAIGDITRLSYHGLTVEIIDGSILEAIKLASQTTADSSATPTT